MGPLVPNAGGSGGDDVPTGFVVGGREGEAGKGCAPWLGVSASVFEAGPAVWHHRTLVSGRASLTVLRRGRSTCVSVAWLWQCRVSGVPALPLTEREGGTALALPEARSSPHELPRIVRNPRILGGRPIVEGTRVPVRSVVISYLNHGRTVAAVYEAHPSLPSGGAEAALAFYEEHREEIARDIAAQLRDDLGLPPE